VLLVLGGLSNDPNAQPPHVVIPARRLFDQQMKSFTFKGEAEVMKELDFLTNKRERQRIYFLQGDNELDINEKQPIELTSPTLNLARLGAGKLVENLTKDNYDVHGLSFRPADPEAKETNIVHVAETGAGKKAEVPTDCDTLVILSPSSPFSADSLDAIERYMDRGGRLFVGIGLPAESDFSKLKVTGLEGLLKKFGVDVTDQYVLHFPTKRFPSPYECFVDVAEKGDTVLSQQFAGKSFGMITPRIVKSAPTAKYKVEPLLVADPEFAIWKEDSLDFFRANPMLLLRDRLAGRDPTSILARSPVPVAVTVTHDAKPRAVVVGSGEFLANFMFNTQQGRANYDLFAGSLAWMSERKFIGPRPVESANYIMSPEADYSISSLMSVGTSWTLIALLFVIGGCVWTVRRH
jgi:hypothetical protein